jgi:hypothetical protein
MLSNPLQDFHYHYVTIVKTIFTIITITLNGTFEVAEDAYLIDDALENPDWPTSHVAIPEEPSVDIGAETTINPISLENPEFNPSSTSLNVTIPEENSTPRPATDRQLRIANFEEESLNLTLKWSDEVMKIVKLESKGDMDEDCFYKGSYIEDHTSGILITGCEMRSIQIQSPVFGDYLGTITVNGTFEDAKEAYLIDDALENPDWNPTSIASTPKPATDRQLLTANLEEKSIFMLELKWSDEIMKIVKLESKGDNGEDCFYNGHVVIMEVLEGVG